METRSEERPRPAPSKWILGVASLMILAALGCGGYAFHLRSRLDSAKGPEGVSEADRQAIRKDMMKMGKELVGLSDEQVQKLGSIWDGPPKSPMEFQARRKKMLEVLTPEQQKKWAAARPIMMRALLQKRMEQIRGSMTPAEFEAMKAKRIQQAQMWAQQKSPADSATTQTSH